jgi:hypothetical protein
MIYNPGMANLVIWARIVEQAAGQYLVIVSTAKAAQADSDTSTDLRTVEARTYKEAEGLRDNLIGVVARTALSRGHEVVKVNREATVHQ